MGIVKLRVVPWFYSPSLFFMHIWKQGKQIHHLPLDVHIQRVAIKSRPGTVECAWRKARSTVSRILGAYQRCYLHGSTFSKTKFTAMINSNCQAPLLSSDNPSCGSCVCTERKTAIRGRRGKEKKKQKNSDSKAEMAGDSYRFSPAADYQ